MLVTEIAEGVTVPLLAAALGHNIDRAAVSKPELCGKCVAVYLIFLNSIHGQIGTRYWPVPYSFSPPSMVERLLRPLLPPMEKPVVRYPVKPGFCARVESELLTPGSV